MFQVSLKSKSCDGIALLRHITNLIVEEAVWNLDRSYVDLILTLIVQMRKLWSKKKSQLTNEHMCFNDVLNADRPEVGG